MDGWELKFEKSGFAMRSISRSIWLSDDSVIQRKLEASEIWEPVLY